MERYNYKRTPSIYSGGSTFRGDHWRSPYSPMIENYLTERDQREANSVRSVRSEISSVATNNKKDPHQKEKKCKKEETEMFSPLYFDDSSEFSFDEVEGNMNILQILCYALLVLYLCVIFKVMRRNHLLFRCSIINP